MKPKLSYTIWFTQRTGSDLLCKAHQGTGIAGKPDEWRLHLSEGSIVPLTIVYEDFIQEYEKTVRKVLEFLELDTIRVVIPLPC